MTAQFFPADSIGWPLREEQAGQDLTRYLEPIPGRPHRDDVNQLDLDQ